MSDPFVVHSGGPIGGGLVEATVNFTGPGVPTTGTGAPEVVATQDITAQVGNTPPGKTVFAIATVSVSTVAGGPGPIIGGCGIAIGTYVVTHPLVMDQAGITPGLPDTTMIAVSGEAKNVFDPGGGVSVDVLLQDAGGATRLIANIVDLEIFIMP